MRGEERRLVWQPGEKAEREVDKKPEVGWKEQEARVKREEKGRRKDYEGGRTSKKWHRPCCIWGSEGGKSAIGKAGKARLQARV